jgi:hypothetical protein
MEANVEREHVSLGASSVPDDPVKSRILERIKAQMDQEFADATPGIQIPPIYLKMIDGWP